MNETSLIRFDNDYSDGAHPAVLSLLAKTNDVRTGVYSEDIFCGQAAGKIRALCENGSCAVHFMTGGTITNMTLITAALRPYQGVISSSVGHINIHETGAIEARGHKVLTIPSFDGKITAGEVKRSLRLTLPIPAGSTPSCRAWFTSRIPPNTAPSTERASLPP